MRTFLLKPWIAAASCLGCLSITAGYDASMGQDNRERLVVRMMVLRYPDTQPSTSVSFDDAVNAAICGGADCAYVPTMTTLVAVKDEADKCTQGSSRTNEQTTCAVKREH